MLKAIAHGGDGTTSSITGLITAGTNVSITGSGTSGSPYNISSSGSGGSSATEYATTVANFASLPAASSYSGQVALVLANSGVYGFRKLAGVYYSDGTNWLFKSGIPSDDDTSLNTSQGSILIGRFDNTAGPQEEITLGSTLIFSSSALQTVAMSGDVTSSANSFATTIKSSVALSGNPTAATQAPSDNSTRIATTAYVAAAILGQDYKEACKYASTAALPSIVYANGSSGVGATLTGVALAAISLDSSSPSVNDRVLIKNQVSSFQNGIYTVTATGSGIAVFVLTRAADFNQSAEIDTGDTVFITAGSTQSTTTWAYNGTDQPVIGTDPMTFAQTAGQGSFTAGNGISIGGTSIAIDTSITVDKTTAQTLTNKTLTSAVLITTALGTPTSGALTNCTGLPVAGGGTGAATFTANAVLVGNTTSAIQASPMTVDSSTGAIAGYAGTINAQTGTTYTLLTSDAGKIVEINNASAITLTLPNSLPIGFCCTVTQTGAGQITLSAASGAALHNRSSFTKTAGQYAELSLYVTTNSGGSSAVYIMGGDGA